VHCARCTVKQRHAIGGKVQVGNKTDFNCYRRAENRPDPLTGCGPETRRTLLAGGAKGHGAAESASTAAAGLAAAAALLQDDPTEVRYVEDLLNTALAFYDFANRVNETSSNFNADLNELYGVANPDQHTMFTEAMFAYITSCKTPGLVTCNQTKSELWVDLAERHWSWRVVRSFS
jgi:hypothetical protein